MQAVGCSTPRGALTCGVSGGWLPSRGPGQAPQAAGERPLWAPSGPGRWQRAGQTHPPLPQAPGGRRAPARLRVRQRGAIEGLRRGQGLPPPARRGPCRRLTYVPSRPAGDERCLRAGGMSVRPTCAVPGKEPPAQWRTHSKARNAGLVLHLCGPPCRMRRVTRRRRRRARRPGQIRLVGYYKPRTRRVGP